MMVDMENKSERMKINFIDVPCDLGESGKVAASVVLDVVAKRLGRMPIGDGYNSFHSPGGWAARHGGTWMSRVSLADDSLVVVHDGGDLAPFFDPDYEDWAAHDEMMKAFVDMGLKVEQVAGWCSVVTPLCESE